MNGAEVLYRPAYPEPYVSNGMWEIQNRARALDNTCYVVAPNPANYFLTQESSDALDTFGGKSMIVDYQGKILSEHDSHGVRFGDRSIVADSGSCSRVGIVAAKPSNVYGECDDRYRM
jgi:predicted amidohydrolase